MYAPGRRFKRALMEQLLLSLQAAGDASKSMGLRERRDALRVSSDVAMASARGRAAAPWARALVARHAAEPRNEALLRRILGGTGYERARKIVRRSRRVQACSSKRRRRPAAPSAACQGDAMAAARRMVKGRLQLLRKLVPGGEALHGGFTLLSEALDYVVCLKTQVELMQCLCKGSQLGYIRAEAASQNA